MSNKKKNKKKYNFLDLLYPIKYPDGGILPQSSPKLESEFQKLQQSKAYEKPSFLETSPDDKNYYTYSKRPEAKYRKYGDDWYINLGENTGNKYKLISDPQGTRASELNRNAKLYSAFSGNEDFKKLTSNYPLTDIISGLSSEKAELPLPLATPKSEVTSNYQKKIQKFNQWLGNKGYHTPTIKLGKANTEGGLNCINGVCYVLENSGAKKFSQPYTGNLTFNDNLEKEGYYKVDPKSEDFSGFQVGDIIQYAREKGKNSALFPNADKDSKKELYPFHAKLILDSYEKNGKKYYVVGHNGGGTEFITSHELAEDLHKDAISSNNSKKSDGILINRYDPDKLTQDQKLQQFKQQQLLSQYSNASPNIGVQNSQDSNSVIKRIKEIADTEFKTMGEHSELPPETLQELIRIQIGIASQETKFGEDQNPELHPVTLSIARTVKDAISTKDDWRQDYWNKNVDNIKNKYNSLDDFKKDDSLKGKVSSSSVQSKGVFQQKEISSTGKKAGVQDLNTLDNQIRASIYNSVDNYKVISKKYPDLDEQSKIKLTILMHNAPSKALNPIYVSHYLKNNDIDYVNKVVSQTKKYQFADGGLLPNNNNMKKKCNDCDNKKRVKLPPLELNPYTTRPGAKVMASGSKMRYNDGGTYYAPGQDVYSRNAVDVNQIYQETTQEGQVANNTTDAIKSGVSTIIPIAGLFEGVSQMGQGIATASMGDNAADQNYGAKVSEGLFDPFTSQVNMWANDDIDTMDKIGATLLGGFGFSGHLQAKAENKANSERIKKEMFNKDTVEFADAPGQLYGNFNTQTARDGGRLVFREGGDMMNPSQTPNGADMELNSYEGPTHEQGGIPIGPNAEVEGGETRAEDYIFSDTLENPLTGKTFAEESKRIEKKYSGRENDVPSNRAKRKELERLMIANDIAKELKAKEEEAATAQMDADIANTMPLGEGGAPMEGVDGMGDIPMPEADMGIQARQGLEETPVEQFREGGRIKYPNGGGLGDPPPRESSSTNYYTPEQREAYLKEMTEVAKKLGKTIDPNSIREHHGILTHDYIEKPRTKAYFTREPNSNVIQQVTPQDYQKANSASKVGDFYEDELGTKFKSTGANAYKSLDGTTKWYNHNYSGDGDAFYELDENKQRKNYRDGGNFPIDWDMLIGATMQSPSEFGLSGPQSSSNPVSENPYLGDTWDNTEAVTMPTRGMGEISKGELQMPDFLKSLDGLENPEKGEEAGKVDPKKQLFNQDMAALGLSNMASIDNLINSRNVETTEYDKLKMPRVSYEDARLGIQRQGQTQQAIQREGLRRTGTGSTGSALSNLAAGQASTQDQQINALLGTFTAENQVNAQNMGQEAMMNTQIRNQEIDANAANRAMGKTSRNLALANMGENTQGYMRDQKMQKANEDQNAMQWELLKHVAPNYAFMDPEGQEEARRTAQWYLQAIQQGAQYNVTPG